MGPSFRGRVVHVLTSFRVPDDPGGAATLIRRWFTSGWETLGGDLRAAAEGRVPDLAARIAPRGVRVGMIDGRDRSHPLQGRPAFLEALGGDQDSYFGAQAKVLGDPERDLWLDGAVMDTPWFLSMRLRRHGDIVNLDLTSRIELLFATSRAEARVAGFLDDALAVRAVDFAEVGYCYAGGSQTMPEMEGTGLYQSWERAGDRLRGFSWITVVPPRVAARLGGARALAATEQFHEVRPLAGGGVLLRATEHLAEYDDATAARIFPVLAPVLPERAQARAVPPEG
jgi:hypothetical protein